MGLQEQGEALSFWPKLRQRSSLPHPAHLPSVQWVPSYLPLLAGPEDKAACPFMPLRYQASISLSGFWIHLNLVTSSLFTLPKSSSSWAHLNPWLPSPTSVPWLTSRFQSSLSRRSEQLSHFMQCLAEYTWQPRKAVGLLSALLPRPVCHTGGCYVGINIKLSTRSPVWEEQSTLLFPFSLPLPEVPVQGAHTMPCLPVLFTTFLGYWAPCWLPLYGQSMTPLLPALPPVDQSAAAMRRSNVSGSCPLMWATLTPWEDSLLCHGKCSPRAERLAESTTKTT